METKIYLIPGLGADARMYAPQMKVLGSAIVLEHQRPLPGETLTSFAQRLTTRIDISEPFILIGTSLGGIICMEMARIIHPDKVILISSVKHRGELPPWMRAMKHLRLHRLMSGRNYIKFSNRAMSMLIHKRDPEATRLLMDMHRDADPDFVQWAIDQVLHWSGPADYRQDVIHIHGTCDRLFPYRYVHHAIPIHGGSHAMGLTQPDEVNKALLEALRGNGATQFRGTI